MPKGKGLLCDFHVHSKFSDGTLLLSEVVDLYGRHGFDAIAITDHIPEEKTWIGKASQALQRVLTKESFRLYREALLFEKERAWDQYKMVVIPGFELSKNAVSNRRSAHILGLGVSEFLYADAPVDVLCTQIHDQGGVTIAAHPVFTQQMEKQTYFLWDNREVLASHFDAWEVASGPFIFEPVRQHRLPKIASSDFHRQPQLSSWKTLCYSEKKEEAILAAIKKQNVDFTFFNAPILAP